jgi:AbiV family abortive infection protein
MVKGFNVMIKPKIRAHLEKYWGLARSFHESGDFALSAFFAITLIEECGKIILWGNAKLGQELDQKSFRNHGQKYRYAVGAALLVNARVTRIYGKKEKIFASWFRKDELFNIRNTALYVELKDDDLVDSAGQICKEASALLTCIAGEIWAELQGIFTGTGPDEWQRILREVDDFRNRHLADDPLDKSAPDNPAGT